MQLWFDVGETRHTTFPNVKPKFNTLWFDVGETRHTTSPAVCAIVD